MAKKTAEDTAEVLRKVVNETTGTALTISPKEEGWSGYLLQQKKHFDKPTLDELHVEITEHIIANRTPNEKPAKESKRKYKAFKYDKK